MVVAKVLDRMAEVLGLDLDFWRQVDLEMLGALIQWVLEYLGSLRGLAWVLLLGVVVLGLVILLSLGVLEFRFLLALEDCLVIGYSLVLVLVFLLRCWIHILRSLCPGLGLESVLELECFLWLEVLLSSLLERQALVSMVLVQQQGLW